MAHKSGTSWATETFNPNQGGLFGPSIEWGGINPPDFMS